MVNQCDLHTTARILEDASYVISHDTATMHIAAAFRKKILSVWGATAPGLGMYPYLPKAFEKYSVIVEKENLSCHPCSKLGNDKCPKGHFKCLTTLDQEKVMQKINELLSQ
jgi:ADP-heptose:LPS heptosyltransferase